MSRLFASSIASVAATLGGVQLVGPDQRADRGLEGRPARGLAAQQDAVGQRSLGESHDVGAGAARHEQLERELSRHRRLFRV